MQLAVRSSSVETGMTTIGDSPNCGVGGRRHFRARKRWRHNGHSHYGQQGQDAGS